MSFTVYVPRRETAATRGQAVIDSTGHCRLHPADLDEVGIKGKQVIVLTDAGTQRIALRAPSQDPEFSEPTSKLDRGKSGTKACVGLAGPLKAIGIPETAKAKGVHEVMIKDNLLIISLMNPSVSATSPKGKRR